MQIFSPTISGSTIVLGPLIQTGSLTSTGTITAQSLVITSTAQFTGSVSISGSLSATSSWANNATSASYALSSSQASNATTSSYALNSNSASYASGSTSASYALSASQASNATTASYALRSLSSFPFSGAALITGSLSVTGALQLDLPGRVNGYVLTTDSSGNATWQSAGAGASFPYTGNATITGSLTVSGSGINIIGDSKITGSLSMQNPGTLNLTIQNTSTISGYPIFKFRNNAFPSISNGGLTGLFILSDNIDSTLASIAFRKSGSSNVNIDFSGVNVGIGTSTPAAKLDVNGNSIITGLLTVNGNSIITGSLTVYGPINGTANAADNITGYQVASIDNINVGATGSNNYSNVVRAEELEQSKHTTINIFNFINFI